MSAHSDAARQDAGRLKVLIADDDADLRALVHFTLTQGGFGVIAAQDGVDALASFEREGADLLVLDLNMPRCDGLEVCREIRRQSSVPILVLTARHTEDDLIAALDSGADDYVRKPFSPRALLARVKALVRRATAETPRYLSVGTVSLDVESHILEQRDGPQIRLAPMELKALQLLMLAPGRTVSTERLLMHLWGRTTASERRTLKQLIYRLRSKLEQEGLSAALVQTAPGAGYRLSIE